MDIVESILKENKEEVEKIIIEKLKNKVKESKEKPKEQKEE